MVGEIPQLPAKIVSNASVARRIVENAVDSHSDYFSLVESHQRHLDNATPFDPAKLRKANQSWRSNYPFGKAKAKIDKITIEGISSVFGSLGMGFVKFNRFDQEKHGTDEKKQWLRDEFLREQRANDIVSTYADMFESDDRAIDFVSRAVYNTKAFGVGYAVSEPGVREDWLPDAHDIRSVMFPQRARVCDIEKMVIISELPMFRFYQHYLKAKEDPRSAWDIDGLEEILLHFWKCIMKEGGANGLEYRDKDWAHVESNFHDNVHLYNEEDQIYFSKIFNEEVDGSVTVTYIAYTQGEDKNSQYRDDNTLTPKHFLYQKTFTEKKLKDVVKIIRDSSITSSGYVQDMRGLSQFAVPDSHRFNIDKNSMRDKAMLSGNIVFQQTAANAGEKFELSISSVAALLPQGYEPVPIQLNTNLTPLLQNIQLEEQSFQRETQHFDASLAGRLGDRATTKEVEQVSAEVEGAKNAKAMISLRDWSNIHMDNLGRLIKKTFKKTDDGYRGQEYFLSELQYLWQMESRDDVLAVLEEVKSFELELIQGNPQALEQSMSISQSEFSRNELGRQLLYALGNPRRRIDRILPRINRQNVVTDDQQLAELQNEIFYTRGNVLVSSDGDPMAQIAVHFRLFQQAVESVQNGNDPQKIAVYLQNGLEHTAKLLVMAEQDPFFDEEDVKKAVAQQKVFERIQKAVAQAAKQQADQLAAQAQQQADQNGGIDPDAAQKMRIRETESQEKMRRQAEASDFKQQQLDQSRQFKQRQEEERISADISRKDRQAAADTRIKARKAAASAATSSNGTE